MVKLDGRRIRNHMAVGSFLVYRVGIRVECARTISGTIFSNVVASNRRFLRIIFKKKSLRFDREFDGSKTIVVSMIVYAVNIAFFANEKANEEFSNEALFPKKIEFKNSFISMKCNFFFILHFPFSLHASTNKRILCLVHRTKKSVPIYLFITFNRKN